MVILYSMAANPVINGYNMVYISYITYTANKSFGSPNAFCGFGLQASASQPGHGQGLAKPDPTEEQHPGFA